VNSLSHPTPRQGLRRPGSGRWRAILGVVTGLLLLPVAIAHATTVRRLDLPAMSRAADTIVEGRVEGVRSYWEGNRIWTEVRIAVTRAHKGSPDGIVTVLQLGGRVESPVPVAMTVPGAPEHRIGDEGFFFLEPIAPGQAKKMIVGLFQGRVLLRKDDRGPFVSVGGKRQMPGELADSIRRLLAGQAAEGRKP